MFPRPVIVAAATLTAGLVLSACGSADEPAPTAETTPSATTSASATPSGSPSPTEAEPEGTRVDVTIRGNDISPNAEKVKVGLGEEITLAIVSDRDGEFHVHSTPEQVIPFGPGRSEATLSFDRPGLVDVEEHESHKLLVQFEVR